MPKLCFVKNCRSAWSPVSDLSFHQFPLKNEELMKKWMASADNFRGRPSVNSTICSNHFAPGCFRQFIHKRSLQKDSVPTLFDNKLQPSKVAETNGECFSSSQGMIIKKEPIDDIQEDYIMNQLCDVKEESIDLEDFKAHVPSCEMAVQINMDDKIVKKVRKLTRQVRLLKYFCKKQSVQLNNIKKIINQHTRCRRNKRRKPR